MFPSTLAYSTRLACGRFSSRLDPCPQHVRNHFPRYIWNHLSQGSIDTFSERGRGYGLSGGGVPGGPDWAAGFLHCLLGRPFLTISQKPHGGCFWDTDCIFVSGSASEPWGPCSGPGSSWTWGLCLPSLMGPRAWPGPEQGPREPLPSGCTWAHHPRPPTG